MEYILSVMYETLFFIAFFYMRTYNNWLCQLKLIYPPPIAGLENTSHIKTSPRDQGNTPFL